MELKFLPLGSVCVVKNLNNKQVIIGYKNQGYDYIGVPFPKGFSKNQDINYFNHSDIIELYSYGYKDEESKIFISSLPVELKSVKSEVDNENRLDETVDVVLSPKANGGYLFDENGVVVADKLASEVVASDKETNNQNDKVEEPRYVFDKNGIVIEDKKESKTSGNYQFDENGIVVADKETNNQNDKIEEPRYVFDENGVVIEDKKESKTLKNYQFDENGVVVAVDVIVGVVNLGFQPVNISFVIGLRNQKHRVQGCVFRVGGETSLTPVFVAVNKLLCHGIHPGQPHDFLFLAIAVGGQLIDLADCIQKSHRSLLFQKRGAPGSPSDSYSLLSILSMFSS